MAVRCAVAAALASCMCLGAVFDMLGAVAAWAVNVQVAPAFNRPWMVRGGCKEAQGKSRRRGRIRGVGEVGEVTVSVRMGAQREGRGGGQGGRGERGFRRGRRDGTGSKVLSTFTLTVVKYLKPSREIRRGARGCRGRHKEGKGMGRGKRVQEDWPN